MRALQFSRKPGRIAAAAVAGAILPGRGASVGPLRLRDLDRPTPPAPSWVTLRPRLAGICGSDLSTIDGHASAYFEPIVSFPFVPGHEVVGDLDDGSRAVLIPVLSCSVRGLDPLCSQCTSGAVNRCERIAFGHLDPGLQSGFCEGTGGGWSEFMVAHPDQLIAVPDELSDESAVMIEPTACAVHGARAAVRTMTDLDASGPLVVIGSGTLGLLTIAALRHGPEPLTAAAPIIATARYGEQRRWAATFGADTVVEPSELEGAVRLATASMRFGKQLTGGASCVVDCVGSSESLAQALRVVAPGGTVLVVGMPGTTELDLTGLWHREVALRGVYAYERADFDDAVELAATLELGQLVSATYPLSRYRDAIAHAAEAGRRGGVKVAFDLRSEKERNRP